MSQLKYEEGQFRPDFPQGRRIYADRDFLLVLKNCPMAMTFPDNLLRDHLFGESILEILKRTPDGISKLYDVKEKQLATLTK
jgi:hypothetical protein